MKIAILVCTLNEEINISKRIDNIRSLRNSNSSQVDIHVLDNGSTDNTHSEVLRYGKSDNIFLHVLGSIGKCGALYWAFENIDSDYYLLTDANTIFDENIILNLNDAINLYPNMGVYVGNFRSVTSKVDGELFFSQLPSIPMRLRLESYLGIFTGANGGCYCVSKNSIKNIWQYPAVRNDDFVISLYAASSFGSKFLGNVKAYEIENFASLDIFKQKFRDALGHFQALIWLYGNIQPKLFSLTCIAFRLCIWFAPIGVLFLVANFLGYYPFFILFLILINHKANKIIIRIFALYLGFLIGIFIRPKTSWVPIR